VGRLCRAVTAILTVRSPLVVVVVVGRSGVGSRQNAATIGRVAGAVERRIAQ
jgi:hypothetical protein